VYQGTQKYRCNSTLCIRAHRNTEYNSTLCIRAHRNTECNSTLCIRAHRNTECNSTLCIRAHRSAECNSTLCIRAHRNTAQLRHSDGLHITAGSASWGVAFLPSEVSQLFHCLTLYCIIDILPSTTRSSIWSLSRRVQTIIFYLYLSSHIHATCPTHLILHLINSVTFCGSTYHELVVMQLFPISCQERKSDQQLYLLRN